MYVPGIEVHALHAASHKISTVILRQVGNILISWSEEPEALER